jgi:hypothetical protein
MTQNKFKNIKIDKNKTYFIKYSLGILKAKAFMFELGADIRKTDTHLELKTWKVKIHYRNIKLIEESRVG